MNEIKFLAFDSAKNMAALRAQQTNTQKNFQSNSSIAALRPENANSTKDNSTPQTKENTRH